MYPVISEMHSHGSLDIYRKEIRMRGKGLPAKLMYLHCDLMLPSRVSIEPEVFNRFSLSMLQSKLIQRPLIIRMLLLLLALKPYKKYTSSYCLIKSQMNKKVNHRQAVVLV